MLPGTGSDIDSRQRSTCSVFDVTPSITIIYQTVTLKDATPEDPTLKEAQEICEQLFTGFPPPRPFMPVRWKRSWIEYYSSSSPCPCFRSRQNHRMAMSFEACPWQFPMQTRTCAIKGDAEKPWTSIYSSISS